jgi:hypothetical protein
MLTVYFAQTASEQIFAGSCLCPIPPTSFAGRHTNPLVGIQIRPIDPNKRVIPTVRLFLVGLLAIYGLGDFTYLLMIDVTSNL